MSILSYIHKELSAPIKGWEMAACCMLGMTFGIAVAAGITEYNHVKDEKKPSVTSEIPVVKLKPAFPPPPSSKPEDLVVEEALKLAAEKTTIPFKFLLRLANAESTMNPKAKAKTSNACGLTQLTPDVIYPYLFKHGAKHGFEEAALIQRIRLKSDDGEITLKYQLYNDDDKAIIDSSCQKPEFAAIIGAEFLRDIIIYLQKVLHKDNISADEAYAGYVFGKRGSVPIIEASNNRREQHYAAKDFVSEDAINGNLRFFFKDTKNRLHPTSVGELDNILEEKIGTEELPHIEPRDDNSLQVASLKP